MVIDEAEDDNDPFRIPHLPVAISVISDIPDQELYELLSVISFFEDLDKLSRKFHFDYVPGMWHASVYDFH